MKTLIDKLKSREISFFHLVPATPAMTTNPSIEEYLLMWLEQAKPTKVVQAHVAINRSLGSVTIEKVEKREGAKDWRGYLFGDEVFAPPFNEFWGLVAVKGSEEAKLVRSLLKYMNIARVGARSKYCFAELSRSLTELPRSEVRDFEKKISKSLRKDGRFIAVTGLGLTNEELKDLKLYSTTIHFVNLKNMVPDVPSSCYLSIYRLMGVTSDYLVICKPLTILSLNLTPDKAIEAFFLGYSKFVLSPMGWNKLLPADFVNSIVSKRMLT